MHNRGTYHNHRMPAHSRYGSVGGKRILFTNVYHLSTINLFISYIYKNQKCKDFIIILFRCICKCNKTTHASTSRKIVGKSTTHARST